MSNKPIVYWAAPNEVCYLDFAARNNKRNMVTNNLVKTRLISERILDNINSGDKVGVKIHAGEAYNTRYLRHDYVREVVEAVKSKGGIPTLIETQGLGMNISELTLPEKYTICLGHRKNQEDHNKIAHLHGYTESIVGAPLKFIDGEKGFERKIVEIDGIHFKEVSVAAGLFDYDKMVVISRFKGHPSAGFGGALKQLGIGCVAKQSKARSHLSGIIFVNAKACKISKCAQECIKACPVNAIKIENEVAVIDVSTCNGCTGCIEECPLRGAIIPEPFRENKEFTECFSDNAAAVLASYNPENIRYINFALDITLVCDCIVNASMPIIPDLGIFASNDPLAIDKACFDAEINAPGLPILDEKGKWSDPLPPGVEKFKTINHRVDPTWQLDAAVKNGIGSIDYELVKI